MKQRRKDERKKGRKEGKKERKERRELTVTEGRKEGRKKKEGRELTVSFSILRRFLATVPLTMPNISSARRKLGLST